MSLRFGYGTNGFANHRLDDALAVLADLGYVGVALTLDHHHLDPYGPDLARRVDQLAARLDRLGLGVVVETGARYLLDPWRKHFPTLLDEEPLPRLDFLRRAVHVGADLGADAVSFWAGVRPPELPEPDAWDRLVHGCHSVVAEAERVRIRLGFGPEPGMLVQTLDRWFALRAALGEPERFGLTLDVGHCRCVEPDPVARCVVRAGPYLVNVQIDDMRRGVHEHLEFGTGEIDFPPVLGALTAVGYAGLVAVELPRHSHAAPSVARESLAFLRAAQEKAEVPYGRRPPGLRAGPDPGQLGGRLGPLGSVADITDWRGDARRRVRRGRRRPGAVAQPGGVLRPVRPAGSVRCGRCGVN